MYYLVVNWHDAVSSDIVKTSIKIIVTASKRQDRCLLGTLGEMGRDGDFMYGGNGWAVSSCRGGAGCGNHLVLVGGK